MRLFFYLLTVGICLYLFFVFRIPVSPSTERIQNGLFVCNHIDGNHLRYCGVIDKKLVSIVKNNTNINTLTITSEGGEGLDAIELARELSRRDATLYIKHYCLSACASFLIVGVKQVTVENNSILGFHHTTMSLASRVAVNNLIDKHQLDNIKEELIRPEAEFYTENNVNSIWLFAPDLIIQPSCTKSPVSTLDGRPYIRFKAKHMFWVPGQEMIGNFKKEIRLIGNAQTLDAADYIRSKFEVLGGDKLLYKDSDIPNYTFEDLRILTELPICKQ